MGKIDETTQKHHVPNSTFDTVTIVKRFLYDHAGRLDTVQMSVNKAPFKVVAINQYNELGQLIHKKTHQTSASEYLVNTSYAYNIRGWMTLMDNKNKSNQLLFELNLGYTDGTHPQFNGNISNMKWKSPRLHTQRTYNFSYDEINRLTEAIYTGQQGENYNTSYGYDKNGNILHLSRYGHTTGTNHTLIDDLTYAYKGNQLIGVNDGTDLNDPIRQEYGFKELIINTAVASDTTTHEYHYDANGNLVRDENKGIGMIRYNFLNLPDSIDLPTGYIEYLYDAAGIKLRQKSHGSILEETNYIGNFVYEGESSLKFILTDEGRLVPKDGGGFEYEFFIKDHLGNTRLTVQDSSGFAAIKQEDHYYPFGMVMNGLSNPKFELRDKDTKNDYLYNGKEFQDELGLDWYDYGLRYYDATLARWHSVDPRAEKYYTSSPYNYVLNNPLIYLDPQGDTVRVYTETAGTGHVWISVGEGDDMVVYTYGRYAGTNDEWHGVNAISDGPGVLVRLEGQDAHNYNNKKADKTGFTVFQVLDVSDEKVAATMEKQFYSSDKLPSKGEYKDDDRARVIDDYKITSNNCTTKSADALTNSGSKAMESVKVPMGNYQTYETSERPILPYTMKMDMHIKARKNPGQVRVQESNKKRQAGVSGGSH